LINQFNVVALHFGNMSIGKLKKCGGFSKIINYGKLFILTLNEFDENGEFGSI
jgi:hypothetical protein